MRSGEKSLSECGYPELERGSGVNFRTTGKTVFREDEQGSAVDFHAAEARKIHVREIECGSSENLYSKLSPERTVEVLSDISTVYTDLDGTMLPAGAVEFDPETLESLDRFNKLGGRVVCITGKPVTEVMKLAENTPDHIPLEVVAEKGAYYITRTPQGELRVKPLLVSPEMRRDIIKMKSDFEKIKAGLESTYGVRIIPAGDGSHETVLSIDIVDRSLLSDENLSRSEIKVQDKKLLDSLKSDIVNWLNQKYGAGKFMLVDLGNGNFEIGFPQVDKSNVIKFSEAARKDDGSALIAGDGGNDVSAAVLARTLDKVYASAVVHEHTPEALINEATFCVRGEGKGRELLNKIIEAKTRGRGRSIIATNTGPYRKKDGKVELCVGMPLAFYDLMKKIENGAWIYLGDQDCELLDDALSGKLVSVPISREERQAHYGDISNQTLWPLAHKPESSDSVKSFPEAEWLTYQAVCENVAVGIDEKLGIRNNMEERPTVWVHDYQLLAVANSLKKIRPVGDYDIGLYWHIPFPEAAVFIEGLGEERAIQVLKWFSDYHMVGFHTNDYKENYLETCRLMGVKPSHVLVQPISVDVAEISEIVTDLSENGIQFEQQELNDLFDVESLRKGVQRECEYVLCGIERCDDTKATIERLEAWKALAESNPDLFRGKKIVEVIVPSRMEIAAYAERYNRATRLIREINAILLEAIGLEPLHHVETVRSRRDVVAAMVASDKVVTGLAKKDGFNMSATETALVQAQRGRGSLLISDKIGFYASLKEHGLADAVNVLFADSNGAITPECISRRFETFFSSQANVTAAAAIGLGEYFGTYNFATWIENNLQGISDARLYGTVKPFDQMCGRMQWSDSDDFCFDPVI